MASRQNSDEKRQVRRGSSLISDLQAGMSISIGRKSRIGLHPLFSCGPVLDVVDELLYGFKRDGVVDRSTNT